MSTVHTDVVRGPGADALVKAAADADLLVVGSRGRGGFLELMLGSASRAVLHAAPCPVTVIRRTHHSDQSAHSRTTLVSTVRFSGFRVPSGCRGATLGDNRVPSAVL